MMERHQRTLSIADGRFSYKLAGKKLGWDRIGFTLGTSHGAGQGGFEYYMQTGAEPFQCTAVNAVEDQLRRGRRRIL